MKRQANYLVAELGSVRFKGVFDRVNCAHDVGYDGIGDVDDAVLDGVGGIDGDGIVWAIFTVVLPPRLVAGWWADAPQALS